MTADEIASRDMDENSLDCSIIIPTRDKLEFLKPCIESIENSSFNHSIEVIVVDNGSQSEETRDYLSQLNSKEIFTVLEWDHPFNFSAINNFAANRSRGRILCFLNNDIEASDPDWLDKLIAVVEHDEIGACGCLLLYPDSTIQHAGIALDRRSIGKHICVGEDQAALQAAGIEKPVSVEAVTAACLLIKRSKFLQHNGFDEDNLKVSFNDVDLCLRLREKGTPVLLHPGVKLIHHESVSRQSDQLSPNRSRALREFDYMQQRWGHVLASHSYGTGIPAAMKEQVSLQDDLDKILTAAIKHLYRDEVVELPQPTDSDRAADSLASPRAPGLNELRMRYAELQAHTQRIEEAHRLIESSIFWRMTAPLRNLRDLLTGNRPTKEAGRASPADDEEPESGPGAEQDTSDQGISKSQFDREAQRKLEAFLNSGDRLTLPASKQAKVSIALVFYNRAALSYLCLLSILEYVSEDCEVVIVDNASSDETEQLLAQIDGAIVKRNSDNLGFVLASNQAAELASGKYLLLLNNDALLQPGAIETAVKVLEDSDDVGAVGARISLLDGTLQEAGSIIWQDGACVGYGRGDNPQAPQYMFQRDVDYCSGAFLMFELALFRELDGFDEQYAPAYYEESDFCIRLQQLGYRVVYDPRIRISHYEFASSGGLAGASKLQQAHREILCTNHSVYLSQKLENSGDNLLQARTANEHPNLLIIDDRVPFPSLGAGYPRCSHILNSLAQMPVNLTFYPLLFPEDDWSEVYSLLAPNIEVMMGKGIAGLQAFLEQRAGFYQTIMVSRVHNMEIFNQTLGAMGNWPDDIEIIYDAEAVSAPREVLQRRLWGELLSDKQARLMVEEELTQAKRADKVVAVSAQEATIYHDHDIENTTVLGHMLPLEPTGKAFKKRKGLLFVGALRDEGSPNVDSLLWFLVNCLPLIEKQIPDIKLYIVGDNTVPSLSTVTKDNVIFTGRLESIDQYYDDCRVFIAPTRFAAGIPHKVHEAASKGLPSVTTPLLEQQLGWANDLNLLSANSPEEFAQACVQLHSDEKLWQRIREEGLQAVESDCSTEVFRSQLQQLFGVEKV